MKFTLSGNANHTSRYWFAPENSDGVIGAAVRNGQSAYTLVDGRFTFAWRDYKVSVWGKNLTDEYYVVYATTPEASFGSDFLILGEPRTYGMTLSVEF